MLRPGRRLSYAELQVVQMFVGISVDQSPEFHWHWLQVRLSSVRVSPEGTNQEHSVGVILPTRDCVSLLPAHLESMTAWLDVADEVVVVDSHSTDGTREMIRDRLRHPSLRWLDHPPGLYQSWNHGIQSLGTDYLYISTVGDSITRDGLLHLRDVADRLDADVTVSEPGFLDHSGNPIDSQPWPVRRLIKLMNIEEPTCLHGWPLFLFAIACCPDALLGSSASNLYRTSVLQRHPFPTQYGMIGDGAWGVCNALHLRLAITPQRFSHFRAHAKSYDLLDYTVDDVKSKLWELGQSSMNEMLHQRPDWRVAAERYQLSRLFASAAEMQRWSLLLDQERDRFSPWFLSPSAWRARLGRSRFEKEVRGHVRVAIREFCHDGLLPPQAMNGDEWFRS